MRQTVPVRAGRAAVAAALLCVFLARGLPSDAESLPSYYDVEAMFGLALTPAPDDRFSFSLAFTSADPWIVVQGERLRVRAIFGAALLGTRGGDLAASPGTTDTGWTYYEHLSGARPDLIAGYRTQPGKPNRLDVADRLFSFAVTVGNPEPFSGYGLHVLLHEGQSLPNGSETGFVRLDRSGRPVPEAPFVALPVLLVLGVIVRRPARRRARRHAAREVPTPLPPGGPSPRRAPVSIPPDLQ